MNWIQGNQLCKDLMDCTSTETVGNIIPSSYLVIRVMLLLSWIFKVSFVYTLMCYHVGYNGSLKVSMKIMSIWSDRSNIPLLVLLVFLYRTWKKMVTMCGDSNTSTNQHTATFVSTCWWALGRRVCPVSVSVRIHMIQTVLRHSCTLRKTSDLCLFTLIGTEKR